MAFFHETASSIERVALVCLNRTRPSSIACLLFAGICCNLLFQLCLSPVYYRDSSVYYQMTQSFYLADWKNAFPLHLPIFYPALAGLLVCCHVPVMPAMLLVSGIFYALMVFPIFSYLKRFFTERQALIGVLLFVLNYRIARACCAPLLDSGRLFFMSVLIALIFADASFSWKRILLFGLCYAGLALVRSEGVILVGILMAAHFAWLLLKCKSGWRSASARVILPGMIMLVLCLPRIWQFYCETGIPALEARQVNAISCIWNKLFPDHAFIIKSCVFCGGNDMDYSLRGIFCGRRFYESFFGGFLLFYLPFTVWGLFVTIRNRKWDAGYYLLLFIFAAYNVFHFSIQAAASRYFLINSCLALPLTVSGVISIFELSRRWSVHLNRLLLLGGIAASVVLIYKSFFFNDMQMRRDADAFASALRREFPRRANLLLIGDDRGAGYYLGVNVCNYRDYPNGLASRVSLSSILISGVDSEDMGYKHEKTLRSPVFFDAVLLENSMMDKIAGCREHLREADVIRRSSEYTLYRNARRPAAIKEK